MLPSLEKLSTSSSCALSDVVVQKQAWQDKRFVERLTFAVMSQEFVESTSSLFERQSRKFDIIIVFECS
jgi:hypothetical protein